MILPRLAHLVLLVKAESCNAIPRFRAESAEDCALTAWHDWGRVMMEERDCKEKTQYRNH